MRTFPITGPSSSRAGLRACQALRQGSGKGLAVEAWRAWFFGPLGITQQGAVAFEGAGELSGNALKARLAASTLAGEGVLGASASRVRTGFLALPGAGALTGSPSRVSGGSSALAGEGLLGLAAYRVAQGASVLAGEGLLAAVASARLGGLATLAGAGDLDLYAVKVFAPSESGLVLAIPAALALKAAQPIFIANNEFLYLRQPPRLVIIGQVEPVILKG